MNIGGPFHTCPWSYTTKPYNIEDEMEDSLGLKTFSTSDSGLACVNQVTEAICNGAVRLIINLQEQNSREYGAALTPYPHLWKNLKIVIKFDENFARNFSPNELYQQLLEAIQNLNVGKIDCIRYPKPVASHTRQTYISIYENLANLQKVHRAIIPGSQG